MGKADPVFLEKPGSLPHANSTSAADDKNEPARAQQREEDLYIATKTYWYHFVYKN